MSDGLIISAIVPVYNGAQYLPDALASIREQSRPPDEIIVVDDGSTDGSGPLAASLGARVIRQANAGVSAARNAGVAAASGDALAFLDADDVWTPGRLERQAALLDGPLAPDVVLGHLRVVWPDDPSRDAPEAEYLPHFGSALIRAEAFARVGPLDASLRLSEDVDWFMRALECGCTVAKDADVAQLHRRHGANTTHGLKLGEQGLAAVLKRSLDRRRKAASGGAAPLPSVFSRQRPDPRDA